MIDNKCLDCNLCCKLPEIPTLKKKSYSWCKNCNIGEGCSKYEERPQTCKDFYCLYLNNETDLKPSKCGFFIFPESEISYEHKIFTIYCEEHKLKDLPNKLLSDKKIFNLITQNWAFHIRYNNDDNNLAIFDYNAFGKELKYVKRNKNYTVGDLIA